MQGLPVEDLLGLVWNGREAVIRLLAAGIFGGIVGFEREFSGKPAGLRTHVLICLGAALLTQLSVDLARTADPANTFRADPARIAAQIVSGIGFLGAGTILHARGSVTGLTTAASMWVVAAIGMATGAGSYILAFTGTALAVVTLRALTRLEDNKRHPGDEARILEVELADPANLGRVQSTLESHGLRSELIEVRRVNGVAHVLYRVRGTPPTRASALQALLERGEVKRAVMK
jgi:putative Mg2+ transporter-C (MgtC) family protein